MPKYNIRKSKSLQSLQQIIDSETISTSKIIMSTETDSKSGPGRTVRVFLCKFCGYTSKKSDNMNHHIVIHVLGKYYSYSELERRCTMNYGRFPFFLAK